MIGKEQRERVKLTEASEKLGIAADCSAHMIHVEMIKILQNESDVDSRDKV